MTDHTQPPSDPPAERPASWPEAKGWDPSQIIRDRAAATRAQRDASIAELRASMSDPEILDEFGVHLGQIEG